MRSRSLQRSAALYRWTFSVLKLLGVLITASVVIMLLFLFDGQHPTRHARHHISFWQDGRSSGLRRLLDDLLEQMPLGSFLIDRQILSCLVSTDGVYPEVCLGLLLEYDVLEYGFIHQPNTSYNVDDNSCLVETAELVPCQPRKNKECNKYGSKFVSHMLFYSEGYSKLILVTIFYPASQFHAKSSPMRIPLKSDVSKSPEVCLDTEIAFWNMRAKRMTGPHRKQVIARKLKLNGYVTTLGLTSPVLVPQQPATLLANESDAGQYIPCTVKVVLEDGGLTTDHQLFRSRARAILLRTQRILEEHGVRWWLSSGTCLGWFRQCDIIAYSQDVDIGIFIEDYRDDFASWFEQRGFEVVYRLGMESDSLQYSFVLGETKLDVYFFYREGDHLWNGATAYKAGQKFKYVFPSFALCYTDFVEVSMVPVPCETEQYIVANYGQEWQKPTKEWDWRQSPPNSQLNGFWLPEERARAIYLNRKFFADVGVNQEPVAVLEQDAPQADPNADVDQDLMV